MPGPVDRRRAAAPSVAATIDVLPDALVEELDAALAVADRLACEGTRVRFVEAPAGRLRMELCRAGAPPRCLSPSEALRFAAGSLAA